MKILGFILLALVVAGLVALASCQGSAPAEPTGIELDIDRAKTRAPLKTKAPAPAPKARKATRR